MTTHEASEALVNVGSDVLPLDDQIRDRESQDRSHAIREVVKAWKDQQDSERELRNSYAKKLLWAMFVQGIFVNAAFFLIGAECITIDQWTARTFIVAVFTELAFMVRFIVKYLFRDNTKDVFDLLTKL